MLISRRKVLMAPPALLALSSLPIAKARATTTGNWATYFDGSTYLANPGTILVPQTTSDVFVSYLFRSLAPIAPNSINNDILALTSNGISTIGVRHSSTGKKLSLYLQVALNNNTNGYLKGVSRLGALRYNGQWHRMQIRGNTQTGVLKAYLDGTLLPWSALYFSGGFDIPLMTGYGGFPLQWMVSNPNFYLGDLAQVYVSIGTDVDPTDPQVKAGFIDPSGLPVRLPANGEGAVPDVDPIIFLDGPASLFPINMTNVSWDQVQTGDPSALWYDGSYTDLGPNAFTVEGTLGTSTVDPWGEDGTS